MLKCKCLQYLNSLQPTELKLFETYLQSPLYNTDDRVVELFYFIQKYNIRNNAYSKIQWESFAHNLFPNSKNKKVAFRRVWSKMIGLLEDFFVYLKIREQDIQRQNWLLDFLVERGLHDFFTKEFQQAKKLQATTPQNVDSFYQSFLLEANLYNFTVSTNNCSAQTNLQQTINQFELHYVSNKLRYCCEILSKSTIVAGTHHFFLLEEILAKIAQNKEEWLNNVIIQAYYNILLMLMTTGAMAKQHFLHVTKILLEKATQIDPSELYYMYTFATVYCVSKYKRTGANHYLKELFKLYQQMIEKELLFGDELMSPATFKNVLTAAVKLGKFEWANAFIQKYQHKLPTDQRKNTVTYNHGILAFYKKQYDKALIYLNKVNFVDFFHHLNCEVLLLKTHYELGNFSVLQTKIETFRMYINRNKSLDGKNKIAYERFTRLFKRLLRIIFNKEKEKFSKKIKSKQTKDTQKLQQAIKKTEPLIDKTWLLEKVDELLCAYQKQPTYRDTNNTSLSEYYKNKQQVYSKIRFLAG